MHRTIRVALSLGAVTILIGFVYWLTAGVSGEVFLLSPDGKPELAPGAEVHIYRSDDKHSLAAFLAGPLDFQKSLNDINARFPISQAEIVGLSDGHFRRHTIDSLLYMDIFVRVSQYWQTGVARTTTDRSGRFSVRLKPGKYLIHISGQAGKKQAHWLGEVQVAWRSETILSTPIYSYELE